MHNLLNVTLNPTQAGRGSQASTGRDFEWFSEPLGYSHLQDPADLSLKDTGASPVPRGPLCLLAEFLSYQLTTAGSFTNFWYLFWDLSPTYQVGR